MNRKLLFLIFLVIIQAGVLPVGAEIPGTISYQGKLTDAEGLLIDGQRDITFTLFTESSGGGSVWTEPHSDVSVTNGLFNVMLGSTNDLTDVFREKDQLFLEISVEGEPLDPRQKMASTGYALQAKSLSAAWMDSIYPVGAIFISAVPTDPAVLLRFGTWEPFGSGRVLVGISPADPDFDTAEETGGAKSVDLAHNHTTADHTLTEAEMPSHSHTGSSAGAGSHNHGGSTGTAGNHSHSGSTNTTGSHGHSFRTAHNDVNSSSSQGYPYNNGHNAFRTTDRSQRTENNGVIQSSGNHSHSLSINSNGDHSHSISSDGGHTHSLSIGTTGGGSSHNHGPTGSAGDSSQNVMNPYITVYMWKRTE